MSNYDRSTPGRFGAGISRTGTGALDQGLRSYMQGVYNHMAIGVALTGLVAYFANYLAVASTETGKLALTPLGQTLYTSPLRWVIMLAPLAFVMFFSFKINTMSASSARAMFYSFAAAMGLSLSVILLIYTQTSIARAFFITAATFGSLSLYGYTTKTDLSPIGSFCYMALFGIIIASVVNIFVGSMDFRYALSVITVLVFAGLTAWDTQNIKDMYLESDHPEIAAKKSINGALELYLDFINIFQSIITLFGDRR